jgi:glycosyltransferase involved in cell wall biosynthesis
MHILIVNNSVIPVTAYGGTERVIWYLGKELLALGHRVSYLVAPGSHCPFAPVQHLVPGKPLAEQIPEGIDVVHFHFQPAEVIPVPYVVTQHGNVNDQREFDRNTLFVSGNHARRFGSSAFVYNGLDWNDYGRPGNVKRAGFHFLGDASWRVKNVKGAIRVITETKKERLHVLGGRRLNFRMGFRLTLSPRVTFHGMVGGARKLELLQRSKGLVFPVRWHEPFGLALIESLYFGCPVFGTPYGALPEIVTPDTGVLSASRSVLTRAAEESASFSAAHCHQYAADQFNARRMALSYLNYYEQVLSGRPVNAEPPKLLEVQAEKFLPWED